MLQREHSAILLTFIKLPVVIMVFVLPNFEWTFYTGLLYFVSNYKIGQAHESKRLFFHFPKCDLVHIRIKGEVGAVTLV